MSHIQRDEYVQTLTGEISWEQHLRRSHEHLLDLCPACRDEWDGQPGRLAVEDPVTPVTPPQPPPADLDRLEVSQQQVEAERRLLARMRQARRRAKEDLRKLDLNPVEDWPGIVGRSRSRYRSRALAELLLEQAAERARTDPGTAAALAGLVPTILENGTDHRRRSWGRVLAVRAAAHRANALRIQGDLAGADRAFRQLDTLQVATFGLEPSVQGEVASLRASLRLAQRRFSAAADLLEKAAKDFRSADDCLGLTKARVKLANLSQTLGQPAEALALLRTATKHLDGAEEPYLVVCTVTGQVNALCDLDRVAEAEKLLSDHRPLYEGGDALLAGNFILLQARIDLGHGRPDEAERGFTEARDRMLALSRDYDAALTSLYLADALLAAGKTAALRELAGELVPHFEALGVTRETLAALRLLVEAVRAETATSALIAYVRLTFQTEG